MKVKATIELLIDVGEVDEVPEFVKESVAIWASGLRGDMIWPVLRHSDKPVAFVILRGRISPSGMEYCV